MRINRRLREVPRCVQRLAGDFPGDQSVSREARLADVGPIKRFLSARIGERDNHLHAFRQGWAIFQDHDTVLDSPDDFHNAILNRVPDEASPYSGP